MIQLLGVSVERKKRSHFMALLGVVLHAVESEGKYLTSVPGVL